jgi:hypothetical protein
MEKDVSSSGFCRVPLAWALAMRTGNDAGESASGKAFGATGILDFAKL